MRLTGRFAVGVLLFFLMFLGVSLVNAADAPLQPANTDPAYRALSAIGIGSEAVAVNNFAFQRDIGTFNLKTGTLFFLAPVEGKVTGAVFVGSGQFALAPQIAWEKRSVSMLTKSDKLEEDFNVAVFRFTDGSYEEMKKAGGAAASADASKAAGALDDVQKMLRQDRIARYNLSARILQDVLATSPGGLFYAFINGSKYDSREIFAVDPQGVSMFDVQPEEVAFAIVSDSNKYGIWYAAHLIPEYAAGKAKGTQANSPIDIQKQVIAVELEKRSALRALRTRMDSRCLSSGSRSAITVTNPTTPIISALCFRSRSHQASLSPLRRLIAGKKRSRTKVEAITSPLRVTTGTRLLAWAITPNTKSQSAFPRE